MEVRGKVLANGVNILPGISALALMAKHKPRTLRLDSKLAISSGFLGPFATDKKLRPLYLEVETHTDVYCTVPAAGNRSTLSTV